MQLLNHNMEPIVLRESVRARVSVAPFSVLATFLSICLYIPFMVIQGVTYGSIALWAMPIMLLMIIRGVLSHGINQKLDAFSDAEVQQADGRLRISSVVNQGTVGLGVWIVQTPEPGEIVVPLFMTLIVVIWSIGVLANLLSDFRTFILSMPLMMGENAVFWLLQGDLGLSIGLSMILATLLMVMSVRRGSAIFRDSILMRFEKDAALNRVEAERQNTQNALRQAQAANDAKAYFMAAASHDIKQPLQALGLLTDTLLMSNLPPSTVPVLQSQRESITLMTAHFDALMDMGRFEGGHFQLTISRFRLGDFASCIDREIAPLCAANSLAWQLDMDNVLVSTDEALLLRLMRNLLTNAVRYTDSGTVSCRAKATQEWVEFEIADTGCGIAAEDQEVVFNEFVRLANNGVRSSGAGLGLSIVKKISQALELELQMSSSPGVGTRFTFRLANLTALQ
ncbi:MAG: HAMP domain-containing histidine kinase [Haliea sp.]|nr:HAMP domain-containing histidine kinase [Haliea sp.]